MPNFTPITNGSDANAATFNAPLTQLDDAIEGLTTGDKELTSPDIQDYTYAQHDHTDAAGGGQIPFDAIDTSAATDGQFLRVQSSAVVAETVVIPDAVPTGAVQMFAGSSAPSGWLLCYGQAVSRTTYADLFTAIGTAYGVGDGSTTFNLPDLRGRVPGGLDNMGGSSANRITDVSADSLGGAMGAETHTLTASEIPPNNVNADNQLGGISSRGLTQHIGSASSAHNNVQPTLFFNFIIKI